MTETTKKQVYAIIATRNPKAIAEKIEETNIPNYAIKDDSWFVVFGGTTRELAEKLGIRDGTVGSGLVVNVQGYSGRSQQEVWEWLKLNWPQDG